MQYLVYKFILSKYVDLLIVLWYLHHHNIWRPPILGELTPIIFNIGLTHLDLEAST